MRLILDNPKKGVECMTAYTHLQNYAQWYNAQIPTRRDIQ